MTDVRTRLIRGWGLSGEDADAVITLISTEAITRYLADQEQAPPPAPVADPLGALASQVVDMIADAMMRAIERRAQEAA
jgi:hypothetical protein